MSSASASSSLSARLGFDRGAILHVDDLGMCHSGNQAFLDLFRRGLVTSGSVMVPCPWFREIAEAAATDSALDLGVHLTLTSEWDHYRWAPISTASRTSGLIDDDGYFWRDPESLRRHMVSDAAQVELRAQIERALSAGMRPTHIDNHMAAGILPELLDCHVALAMEYKLVPVLPKRIQFAPDQEAYTKAIAALDAAGLPLPDAFTGTLAVSADQTRQGYREMVAGLPAGVTHIALHSAIPGDIEAITPLHAPWRTREFALLSEGAIKAWCAAEQVETIGYRRVQQLWF